MDWTFTAFKLDDMLKIISSLPTELLSQVRNVGWNASVSMPCLTLFRKFGG